MNRRYTKEAKQQQQQRSSLTLHLACGRTGFHIRFYLQLLLRKLNAYCSTSATFMFDPFKRSLLPGLSMPGTLGRRNPPKTKTVTVYRNGDAFFQRASNLGNFLTCLTGATETTLGVRKLYIPTQGHKVKRLDDLKHGSAYVAAGTEAFKKLDYCETSTKKPQNEKKEQIRPVVHSRIVVSARCKRTADESCTVYVFTNGQVLVPAARILIPKHTLRSWESVLAMVTEKVRLRTGAVFRLCMLDGQPVSSSAELKNNQYYVAVGSEKFKALPYDQYVPRRNLVRKNNTTERQDTLPPTKTKTCAKMFAHTSSGEDLEHAAKGQIKKHTARERTKQRGQVSKKPVLLLTGEGNLFNAQNIRSEMAGAAEVEEDSQLKVDLPFDQVEAKIVEEEYGDRNRSVSPCKA